MKKSSAQSSEPESENKEEQLQIISEKQQRLEYTKEFIAQCKDYAVIGLYPPQIAERLGLEGRERENFLYDCSSKLHPLHILTQLAYAHGQDDIQAALVTAATGGDTDAMEIAMKKRHEDNYLAVRKELFGF